MQSTKVLKGFGSCEHGRIQSPEELEEADPWREDGTYMPGSDSVVCTYCYIAIGQPLLPVRPEATPDSPSRR